MVLVMFVDSGQAALLPALAGGGVHLSPSIVDPGEWPPTGRDVSSEFIQGMVRFQTLGDKTSLERLARRQAFLQQQGGLWQPAPPTHTELILGHALAERKTRRTAKALDPTLKVSRVDPGEAECAAIALTRSWRLWSDDSGIVPLMRILHPQVTIERTCALVARAINDGLLSFAEGADLYERVFKIELGLRSKAELRWDRKKAICVQRSAGAGTQGVRQQEDSRKRLPSAK